VSRLRHRVAGLFLGAALVLVVCVAAAPLATAGAPAPAAPAPGNAGAILTLDDCNVTWDSASADSSGSMPVGNGDIGLNVWVEAATGDLLFYIGKTDSWGDNVGGDTGLPKVGRVRVKLTPSPFKAGAPFRQTLKLADSQIVVTMGQADSAVEIAVWVDANNPVIHVEAKSQQPVTLTAAVEPYRARAAGGLQADQVFQGQKDRVAWCYRNKSNAAKQLVNLTFGAVIKGPGLTGAGDNQTLKSAAGKAHRVDVYVLTAQTPTAEAWLAQLDKIIQTVDATPLETARKAHVEWWKQFWARSWILLGGDDNARRTGQGYALQRYVQACMGRGAYPIKFNGGIFTCDMRRGGKSADARTWGGQYWFQNTRPMYWPMLQAGDFEMMMPLFRMVKEEVANNAAKVKQYYNHDGSYMAETSVFWGAIERVGPEAPPSWTNRYYTPVLEATMMMLDYYEYTGDKAFVRDTIIPTISQGLLFFDKHFPRDAQGKLLLDPDNSIEMYWKVKNPAPDIAGLHAILTRLLALPDDLVDAAHRAAWKKMLSELPPLPIAVRKGAPALLPMEDGQNENQTRNSENPELYAIYPFRLYGLGMPGLDLARHTFDIRRMHERGCWSQDPPQSALLGLSDEARRQVTFNLQRKDPNVRFLAFWETGHDYCPDEDNGGNGMLGLQLMLIQSVDHKILLLPAWPRDWNASFKLHAAFNTTVEGTVRGGKVEGLKVTPASRLKDVEIVGANGATKS
jgi:alpha-L-fucosidase 2